MSKRTLKLLQALSFLTKDNSVADLGKIPTAELAGRLQYYHEQRTQSVDQEAAEIISSQLRDSAFLSSVSAANAVMALGPKLLVHEVLIVDDPLFSFAAPTHEHTKVARESMGMARDDGVDLAELHNKLLYFSELAPLIEAGFLYAIPVSLLHKGPDVIPVNAPKNLYRERVPPGAVDFVFDSVIVRPMERTPEGIIILDEPNHRRSCQISITFKDDDAASHASFYQFRKVQFHGKNPDGSFKLSWKAWCDDPLDEAQYVIWEEQVINQTVGARLDAVAKEMRLAEVLGAPYLTESKFEAELLARSGGEAKGDPNTLAVNFLEANSGLLNLTDPVLLFKVRTDNSGLFDRFRQSLREIGQELQGVTSDEFANRARQLFKRDIQPQIAEINSATSKVVESAGKGLLQTGGGLALALLTGPSIPVAGLLCLAANGIIGEAIPAVGDYLRSRKQPEFIWKKLAVNT